MSKRKNETVPEEFTKRPRGKDPSDIEEVVKGQGYTEPPDTYHDPTSVDQRVPAPSLSNVEIDDPSDIEEVVEGQGYTEPPDTYHDPTSVDQRVPAPSLPNVEIDDPMSVDQRVPAPSLPKVEIDDPSDEDTSDEDPSDEDPSDIEEVVEEQSGTKPPETYHDPTPVDQRVPAPSLPAVDDMLASSTLSSSKREFLENFKKLHVLVDEVISTGTNDVREDSRVKSLVDELVQEDLRISGKERPKDLEDIGFLLSTLREMDNVVLETTVLHHLPFNVKYWYIRDNYAHAKHGIWRLTHPLDAWLTDWNLNLKKERNLILKKEENLNLKKEGNLNPEKEGNSTSEEHCTELEAAFFDTLNLAQLQLCEKGYCVTQAHLTDLVQKEKSSISGVFRDAIRAVHKKGSEVKRIHFQLILRLLKETGVTNDCIPLDLLETGIVCIDRGMFTQDKKDSLYYVLVKRVVAALKRPQPLNEEPRVKTTTVLEYLEHGGSNAYAIENSPWKLDQLRLNNITPPRWTVLKTCGEFVPVATLDLLLNEGVTVDNVIESGVLGAICECRNESILNWMLRKSLDGGIVGDNITTQDYQQLLGVAPRNPNFGLEITKMLLPLAGVNSDTVRRSAVLESAGIAKGPEIFLWVLGELNKVEPKIKLSNNLLAVPTLQMGENDAIKMIKTLLPFLTTPFSFPRDSRAVFSSLPDACRAGHAELLKFLFGEIRKSCEHESLKNIIEGDDIAMKYCFYALCAACEDGNPTCVELMLSCMNVDSIASDNFKALKIVCNKAFSSENNKCAEMLLNVIGLDGQKDDVKLGMQAAIKHACSRKNTQLLKIFLISPVIAYDHILDGQLGVCDYEDNISKLLLDYLKEKPDDPEVVVKTLVQSNFKMTHKPCREERDKCLEKLINFPGVLVKHFFECNNEDWLADPVSWACTPNRTDKPSINCLTLLLNFKDKNGECITAEKMMHFSSTNQKFFLALETACYYGHEDAVECLLAIEGTTVEHVTAANFRALRRAVQAVSGASCANGHYECIKKLLNFCYTRQTIDVTNMQLKEMKGSNGKSAIEMAEAAQDDIMLQIFRHQVEAAPS
jgi:hypothetical protein